ncbi:MAG: TRAP transporter small permease subunit [Bdellovibrio sp.]|nr:MAG: TRAP transporter small permease subunit [Bdellovibrio sp.]
MEKIFIGIDKFQKWIGGLCGLLLLFMMLLVFGIVVLRYVFNKGWVWLQDLSVYLHAIVFLLSMGYGLLQGAHVRVDVLYNKWPSKTKYLINLLGGIFLLIPFCLFVIWISYPYVRDSWAVLEQSQDAEGLSYIYILKTFIPLSFGFLFLGALSFVYTNWSLWTGRKTIENA